ncbi:hypothetical protein FV230_29015, partial [Methylobacterium sp. WL6]
MTCWSDSRPVLWLAPALALVSLPLMIGPLAIGPLAIGPASAQEPLFLRIRPSDAPPPAIGSGGVDPEIAAARAAREAVWERSTVRANIAIASVCTGCGGGAAAAGAGPGGGGGGPGGGRAGAGRGGGRRGGGGGG